MRQAVNDARAAVNVARRLSDPAVLLECLGVLLEQDGNSDVLVECQRTVQFILGALTHEPLRRTFMAGIRARVAGAESAARRSNADD